MRVGLVCDFDETKFKIARDEKIVSIELFLNPQDLEKSDAQIVEHFKKVRDSSQAYGLDIWAVHLYETIHLHPDPKKRRHYNKLVEKCITHLAILNASIFSTNTWGDLSKSVDENLPLYKQVFGQFAKVADDHGIKIAMENCPHGVPPVAKNLCYSPHTTEMLFDVLPHPAIGLEYDPSHHIWQGVDTYTYLRVFGDRIYSIHAKDTEIDYSSLGENGYYDGNWWRYRIPGWGEVDWQHFISILFDIGYDGDIIIEHEDPVFSGELFQEGVRLGKRHLEQFLP